MEQYVVMFRKETCCADWNEVRLVQICTTERKAKNLVAKLKEQALLQDDPSVIEHGDQKYYCYEPVKVG